MSSAHAARRVLTLLGISLLVVGCGNLVSMDELAASITAGQTAVAAKLAVTQGAAALANTTGTYDFGSVVADNMAGNFTGSAITFTITNAGGTASSLTVNSVTLSGTSSADFVLSAFTAATLAFNATATFAVTFDPVASGSKTATITIASSDPATPSYAFGITGTGQAFRLPTVSVPAVTSFIMGFVGVGAVNGTTIFPHTVASISAFEMGTYEINYDAWLTVKTWGEAHGYNFFHAGQKGDGRPAATAQEPVTLVSWRDAIAWCNAASELAGLTPMYFTDPGTFLTPYKDSSSAAGIADILTTSTNTNSYVNWANHGYRLPTEQEWEYAARRTGTSTTSNGDRASGDASTGSSLPFNDATYAWFNTNSGSVTHAVGGLGANSLGIYDMSGNVSEWIWDWYAIDANLATTADWHGPDSVDAALLGSAVRVVRGGAAFDADSQQATSLHTNHYLDPTALKTATNPDMGFRVVRVP